MDIGLKSFPSYTYPAGTDLYKEMSNPIMHHHRNQMSGGRGNS